MLPAMAANVFLLSMIQTLVVPALPLIGRQLHTSATTVGWVATATMLTASAVTPLFGRLGDVYGNRRVVLSALLVTLIGSVIAATTHTIGLLIAARVLQGASFGLFPLAISVLRKELPIARLHHALSIAASALGVGSGFALVATGVLTQHGADYRRIFWLSVVLTVAVLALAAKALPRRAGQGGRVDYLGALVLGLGLVALLLPVAQGHEWGWTSARVIGLFAASAVVLVGFGFLQARTREPLVALSLLARRPVLATNLASAFVGFAMFSVFLGATFFVQTPREVAGFGFGASVLRTSVVYMLPGAVLAIPLGPMAGRIVTRFGPRVVLLGASVLGAAALAAMAFLHGNSVEFIVGLVLANVAVAVAYAAMPALLVTHVAPHETGVANSINSIMRTIGGAIGTAIVVTILASETVPYRTPVGPLTLPTEWAYQSAFLLGGAAFTLAALLAAFGFKRSDH
ncbi:MFS transporter [Actinoallomurus purpureus]|uniref:MFS transporter n=1 Tax=Actinoallomurus purpureus TaxID=478114 RepID=UPI002092445A|nr:MFS transporter [Actinoallomurus purpureus]MCO6005397.1 MFS transporter [Actinoallomurus purpureus]